MSVFGSGYSISPARTYDMLTIDRFELLSTILDFITDGIEAKCLVLRRRLAIFVEDCTVNIKSIIDRLFNRYSIAMPFTVLHIEALYYASTII